MKVKARAFPTFSFTRVIGGALLAIRRDDDHVADSAARVRELPDSFTVDAVVVRDEDARHSTAHRSTTLAGGRARRPLLLLQLHESCLQMREEQQEPDDHQNPDEAHDPDPAHRAHRSAWRAAHSSA